VFVHAGFEWSQAVLHTASVVCVCVCVRACARTRELRTASLSLSLSLSVCADGRTHMHTRMHERTPHLGTGRPLASSLGFLVAIIQSLLK